MKSSIYVLVKGDKLWLAKKNLRLRKSPNIHRSKSPDRQYPKSLERYE
jgi:hypothetical protein